MSYELKGVIIQLAINTMLEKINNIESTIDDMKEKNSEDEEFMEMQINHKNQWEELKEFAKEWKIEVGQKKK